MPTDHCSTRRSLALVLPLFVALCGGSIHVVRAEAVDPGATWAPPVERQEEEAGSAAPVAEDDSLSQGRRASPPSLGGAQSPAADASSKPKVAVVLLHQALGRTFDMSVIGRIMEPLVPHVEFIPLPAVKKAVARTRLPPSLIHLPKNLQRVGQAVGADFTLVVEAVGHGRNAGVFAGLVDVQTGETTVAKRVPMPTRALTNSQAIVLVDLIVTALNQATAPSPGAADAPGRSDEGSMAQNAAPASPAPGHDGEGGRRSDEAQAADAADHGDGAAAQDANGLIGPRKARLMVGLALMQRVAHLIDTQKSGYKPPQYAGNGNNTNPIFPGFQLDGEIYSGIATKHRRAWYDQFGIGLHLTLAPVLSYTQTTGGTAVSKIKSLVTQLDAHALYRVLLAPSRTLVPSLTLEVGLSRFAFPLAGAQFPGVAITAPHIGLDLQVPVHRSLLLRVGGGLRPAPSPGGEAGKLLGQKAGGLGFTVGGGLLGSYKWLEAGLKVNFEKTGISYKGTTTLNGTPVPTGGTAPLQFTNIKLTDQLLQVLLTAGVAY